MLQGNSSMPFTEGDKSLQGISKQMPFTAHTYPNAENIMPPKTEPRRVVEAATRASVNMDMLKQFYEKQQMWLGLVKNLKLRAYIDQKIGNEKEQKSIVDITV